MCWTSKKLCKEIAETDLPVFKVMKYLDGRLTSYYWHFVYELNKRYYTEIGHPYYNPDISLHSIQSGFHSYDSWSCKIEKDDLYMQIRDIKSSGIYLILDTVTIKNFAIVKGYIPKGTEYYLNENGEYVSECIVLTKIICKDSIWFRFIRRIKKLLRL